MVPIRPPNVHTELLEKFTSCFVVVLALLSYLKLAETAALMRNILQRYELGDHLFLVETKKHRWLCSCLAVQRFFYLFVRWMCKCLFNFFTGICPLRRIDRHFILPAKWTGFKRWEREVWGGQSPKVTAIVLPTSTKMWTILNIKDWVDIIFL